MLMNKEQIMEILPHRPPMLLVDEILEMDEEHAVGALHLTGDEFFFQGHFPGNPIMPAVFQLEALAQCGGVALLALPEFRGKTAVYTGIDKAKFRNMAKPGVACEDLYNTAVKMVEEAGFADYFMGVGQKAKFIGHGIGLEINEAPVIAPRMKQELEPGMVFALEPKIVLPGVGPLGIENSWLVTTEGVEKLTVCNEEIIEL